MASKSNPGILVDEAVKDKAGDRPFKALPPVKAKVRVTSAQLKGRIVIS